MSFHMTREKTLDANQLRAARALLDMEQKELARLAGVTERTVIRAERGNSISEETRASLRAALEKKGVEFIAENGGGPGVRLRKRGRK